MSDYQDTIRKLDKPDCWDVPGIIRDASERCREHGDEESAAVIDWVCTQWRLTQQELYRLNPDRYTDWPDC